MNANSLRVIDVIALILVIIGGLNWGLVGLFEFDLVAAIFGVMSVLSRIIYVLVGIAAIYVAVRTPYYVHGHTRAAPAERTPPRP